MRNLLKFSVCASLTLMSTVWLSQDGWSMGKRKPSAPAQGSNETPKTPSTPSSSPSSVSAPASPTVRPPKSAPVVTRDNSNFFDFQKLEDLLKDNPNINSVETFIAALPESYRKNFSLVFRSGSAQTARADRPRVLMHGEPDTSVRFVPPREDRLILAYTGGSDGYRRDDTVEIIEFEEQSQKFVYRELAFGGDIAKLTGVSSNERYKFSDRNPELCLTCHKAEPRPIWEPYGGTLATRAENSYSDDRPYFMDWPGIYGQSAGNMDDGRDNERTNFFNFLDKQRNNPRYSQLTGLMATDPNDGNPKFIGANNIGLTNKLSKWNGRRILSFIKATPDYRKYRFAMYASVIGCSDIPSFLPNKVRALHTNADYDALLRESEKLMLPQISTFNYGEIEYYALAGMRYLIEGRKLMTEGRELKMDEWFMNGAKGMYNMFAPGTKYAFSDNIREQWETSLDKELQPFKPYMTTRLSYRQHAPRIADTCQSLKQASLKAF